MLSSLLEIVREKKPKTIKPLKNHEANTTRFSLHKTSQASLGSGDMSQAVKVPKGEDKNEWICVHCIDFYNVINLISGAVLTEYCTESECPKMVVGTDVSYLWLDKNSKEYQKPQDVPAKTYVTLALTRIEKLISDEKIFPPKGKEFPKNFLKIVKDEIFKYIIRIYGHVMKNHWKQVQALGMEAHVVTSCKHFLYFAFEFDLIGKTNLEPMSDFIINRLGEKYKSKLGKK